ncbi:MAG: hypothetical protein GF408_04770 [Candidatus Omnitrophica bacterium]|nr:hypothetical protein [Candidatus Omnitrophota bacterium]
MPRNAFIDKLPEFAKERAKQVIEGEPGKRFSAYHQRFRSGNPLVKAMMFLLAGVFWIIALVLSVAPGPGFLFFLMGLAVLAAQFRPPAELLDAAESRIAGMLKSLREHKRGEKTNAGGD